MADVFLSYSREDQDSARRFAEGLQRAGFSVWWDQTLNAGEAFDEVTEKALHEAKAVVVLWSKSSVASRWVRAEASQADDNGTLVPVMIEPCTLPMKLRLTQTADLSKWKGEESLAWQSFVEGLRRFTGRESVAAAARPVGATASGRKPIYGVIAALVVVALFIGAWLLWQHRQAPADPAPQSGPIRLAVLPFADLSPAQDQQYIADSLAEEILSQLTQISALAVTARGSSFSFRGRDLDPRAIGKQLGVANILEGSLRMDGEELRISVSLIDVRTGTNLLAKSYNRPRVSLFTMQEEIAADVARALQVTLGVGEMSRAKGGSTNVAAIEKYQQGRALHFRSGEESMRQAAERYREAIKLDPKFARAWYGLNLALSNVPSNPEEFAETLRQLESLTPDAWWTQVARVAPLVGERNWKELDATTQRALNLAPSEKDTLVYRGYLLFLVGRCTEALPYLRRATEMDPLSLIDSQLLQGMLDCAGMPAEAQAEYIRGQSLAGEHALDDANALFRILIQQPPDDGAIDQQFRRTIQSAGDRKSLLTSIHAVRKDPVSVMKILRQSLQTVNPGMSGDISLFADLYGDRELALDALSRAFSEPRVPPAILWLPARSGIRSDPRFKGLIRELGLYEYWRSSGNWGDHCKPMGADDFECR